MAADFTTRHRGPYRLSVCRPHPKKIGCHKSEWLPGVVDGVDVADEARALLSDPRDTIVSVAVWSEHEECYATIFNKQSTGLEPRSGSASEAAPTLPATGA